MGSALRRASGWRRRSPTPWVDPCRAGRSARHGIPRPNTGAGSLCRPSPPTAGGFRRNPGALCVCKPPGGGVCAPCRSSLASIAKAPNVPGGGRADQTLRRSGQGYITSPFAAPSARHAVSRARPAGRCRRLRADPPGRHRSGPDAGPGAAQRPGSADRAPWSWSWSWSWSRSGWPASPLRPDPSPHRPRNHAARRVTRAWPSPGPCPAPTESGTGRPCQRRARALDETGPRRADPASGPAWPAAARCCPV